MGGFFARLFGGFRSQDPVITEWERYARWHSRTYPGAPLGEEWNRPESIGVDAPGEQLVEHLDHEVFAPWLGPDCGTLLEIGAGGGRFTAILAPRVRRLLAADTSPTMVKLLRTRFAGTPNVEPLLLDGKGLAPIADHSVDAAFSYDVFVHLSPWTIYAYLEELRRVLVPGGRALVHHGNTFSELGWSRFLYDVEGSRKGGAPDARFTLMTPDAMAGLAGRAGLVIERAITDVVRRDCITLLRSLGPAPSPPSGGS